MKIVGFGQTFRLSSAPAMGHEIRVELDDGQEVSIQTSEETVTQLVSLWSKTNNLPLRQAPITPVAAPRYPESYVQTAVSEVEESEVEAVSQEEVALPFQARPAVQVEKDEMGYPVVKVLQQPKFLREEDEDGQQI